MNAIDTTATPAAPGEKYHESAIPTGRVRGLLAWAAERFPARNGVFFLTLYVTALVVGRGASGDTIALGLRDVPGFIALWAFFLVLRVLDEHKDFAADAVAHPERVLQRGVVTLGELRAVGLTAAMATLGISVWLDGGTLGRVSAWCLAVATWSFFMAREFFAPRWLRERLITYAVSHMCVMPLVMGWLLAMGGADPTGSRAAIVLLVFAFASGLAFEMGRKMRAPSDERPMADSYTKALGVHAASDTLLVVTIGASAMALAIVRLSNEAIPATVSVVAAAAAILVARTVLRFRGKPTSGGAKAVEAAVGIAMLVVHVVIITAIAASRGVEVR